VRPLSADTQPAQAIGTTGGLGDFATVWGQGHTKAERTGDATSNFIEWVAQSVAG
jgi:hypothetical protein